MVHTLRHSRKAFAWLSSGAVALGATAVVALQWASPSAAPAAGGATTALTGATSAASTSGTQSCGSCAGNSGNGAGNGAGATTPVGKSLSVVTSVSGRLAPGVPGRLAVTVTNPNNQPVTLTSVRGTVTGVSTGTRAGLPACDKSWIAITPYTGSRLIDRNSSTVVDLDLIFVNKADVNQDNCRGVTYAYSITASAAQA